MYVNPYNDDNERIAYAQGFHDGYIGAAPKQSDWTNAYSRGYWDGRAEPRIRVDWSCWRPWHWAVSFTHWVKLRLWELRLGPITIGRW